jgi:hypothetical protein
VLPRRFAGGVILLIRPGSGRFLRANTLAADRGVRRAGPFSRDRCSRTRPGRATPASCGRRPFAQRSITFWAPGIQPALHGDPPGGVLNVARVVRDGFDGGRRDVLLEAVALRRPQDRHDPRLLGQQPSERDWGRRRPLRTATAPIGSTSAWFTLRFSAANRGTVSRKAVQSVAVVARSRARPAARTWATALSWSSSSAGVGSGAWVGTGSLRGRATSAARSVGGRGQDRRINSTAQVLPSIRRNCL